ncbi:MAG: hypothetical protein JKY65_11955 [Planctomycetes bacterium]|nr:hypothetical protein [Planctomycetota bacterium]
MANPGSTPPRWPLWVFLYVLALLFRALISYRTASIYPDGIVDLRIAEALVVGDWHGAIELRFHPLFGALCALLVKATGLSFPQAGAIVAVSCSALVAPACGRVAAVLVPRAPLTAALCAGVLAAAHPYLARLGAQVMNYPVAHACLALSLAAAAIGLERARAGRRTVPWFVLAGVALGLGYSARSDALASGAGLVAGATLALAALKTSRDDAWARRLGRALLRGALPILLGAGLGVAPFVIGLRLHHGAWLLSPKKPVATLLAPRVRIDVAPSEETASLDRWITREMRGGGAFPADPLPPGIWGGAVFAVRKALSVAHPLLLAVLFCGLLLGARPPPYGRGTLDPGAFLLPALTLAAFVGAHVLLKASVWGYTSRLHQSAVGIPIAILAGAALAGLGRSHGWPRSGLALLLGLIVVVLGPKTLEPQLVPKAIEVEVGRALRAHNGPGPIVVLGRDELRPVTYAARAYLYDLGDPHRPELRDQRPEESIRLVREEARRRGASPYLAVFLRSREPLPGDLERELRRHGASRFALFESRHEGRTYTWYLYSLRRSP